MIILDDISYSNITIIFCKKSVKKMQVKKLYFSIKVWKIQNFK